MSSNRDRQHDYGNQDGNRGSAPRRPAPGQDGRQTSRVQQPGQSGGMLTGAGSGASRPSNTPYNSNYPAPMGSRASASSSYGTSDIQRGMANMTVGSPPSYGRMNIPSNPTTAAYGRPPVAGPSSATMAPSSSSASASAHLRANAARVEVTPSEYTDETGIRRTVNIKRVRATTSQGGPRNKKDRDGNTIKAGSVIEVHLTPPPESSFVSNITPSPNNADGMGPRVKRFVVVRDHVGEDENSFAACPIKTYNGEGVAAAGVIKCHHAIIYTGEEPDPEDDEVPNRPERPMQPQAIQVVSYDRGKALDPMARLDYSSRYTFDYAVPNMAVFGRVHQDSLATLYAQLNLVHEMMSRHAGSTLGSTSASSQRFSSTASTAGSTMTVTPASRPNATSSATSSGQISFDDMRRIVARLRSHAQQNGLSVPNELEPFEIRALAMNSANRTEYIRRVRQSWEEGDDEEDDEDD